MVILSVHCQSFNMFNFGRLTRLTSSPLIVACPSVSVFTFVSYLGGHSRYFWFVMSQPRHWPLSQTANKVSVVCSVCQAVRQIRIKNGTIHYHDPKSNLCPGSDSPPVAVAATPTISQSDSGSQSGSDLPPHSASSAGTVTSSSRFHPDFQPPTSHTGGRLIAMDKKSGAFILSLVDMFGSVLLLSVPAFMPPNHSQPLDRPPPARLPFDQ